MGQGAAGFSGSGQVECSRQFGHTPYGDYGKTWHKDGVDIINDVAALSDEGDSRIAGATAEDRRVSHAHAGFAQNHAA